MMNGPRMPFRGGMPPQSYMPPMQARPPMGSMMRGAPQMRQGGGGGLLAKLMGGGQARGAAGAAGAASRAAGTSGSGAGGILKALSNPAAINGFLSNTQKVLNTAQQVGPMVQQYGPLVKNIPAMWKLYRGLKNGDDKTASADEKTKKETASVSAKKTSKIKSKEVDLDISSPKQVQKNGQSVPKLYV
ncbi:VrrA/YqfQ family protein [Cytobacillus massiliigabonensis]|uniref:VrrA/YqfQ family protein n=1 Tax=Cytobacillus massiliigabonensis TaxID=1871011 RepID=UPI000C8429B0|nr:VrrA/YqfQ family protein [Cytobacillus massiliigabonensis]